VHVQKALEVARNRRRTASRVEDLLGAGEEKGAGVSTKKSNSVDAPSRVCASRKPPPPRLVSAGSASDDAKPAATAASKALPPARSTSSAAPVTLGWPEAATPRPE
jgi:hypothetical protein